MRVSLAMRQRLAALVVFFNRRGCCRCGWALRLAGVPLSRSARSGVGARGRANRDCQRHEPVGNLATARRQRPDRPPRVVPFYASERGVASKIRAGAYFLSARMSPRQILDTLLSGRANRMCR